MNMLFDVSAFRDGIPEEAASFEDDSHRTLHVKNSLERIPGLFRSNGVNDVRDHGGGHASSDVRECPPVLGIPTVNGNGVVTIISLKGRTRGSARYYVKESGFGKNILDLDAPSGIIIRRFEVFDPLGGNWSVGHNGSE